jgi:uncharacterized membrane protein
MSPPTEPDVLTKGLGYFSLGLGVAQLSLPRGFDRWIGVRPDAASTAWTLAVGVREVAAAAGILSEPKPAGWVWARVGGDVMDLALLLSAFDKAEDRRRLTAATASVVGVMAVDALNAIRLSTVSSDRDRHIHGETVATVPEAAKATLPMRVDTSVTIRRDPDEVYRFWHDFENLPRFMTHLESVETDGNGRSRWRAKAPIGNVEWEAEIVEDREAEHISWRSVEGAMINHRGTVRFVRAPGGRGTEVHVSLEWDAPGGPVTVALLKALGEEPGQQTRDDLRRFKQVMETGEVVRSEGSPEGQTTRRFIRQRPAQPLPMEAAR